MICNYDCFNCKYDDCINKDINLNAVKCRKWYEKNKEAKREYQRVYQREYRKRKKAMLAAGGK